MLATITLIQQAERVGPIDWITMIIMSAIIGFIADLVIPGKIPFGFVGAIVAGFVGAVIGAYLLGDWGPTLGGFFILPAIIGAIVFGVAVRLVMSSLGGRRRV